MPKISVISIAKDEKSFSRLNEALKNQTYHDFEFVTSTKGTISQAWNDAISRSKGEILVFTESDAFPLNNSWLEEIISHAQNSTILKGLEINPSDLDLCNLVCDASLFRSTRFDESYNSGEDVELFSRLRRMGIKIQFINAFPVVHTPSVSWRKSLARGFKGGLYITKTMYLHGRENLDDINTRNYKSNKIHPVSNRLRIITENALFLLGLLVGSMRYLNVYFKRVRSKNTTKSVQSQKI